MIYLGNSKEIRTFRKWVIILVYEILATSSVDWFKNSKGLNSLTFHCWVFNKLENQIFFCQYQQTLNNKSKCCCIYPWPKTRNVNFTSIEYNSWFFLNVSRLIHFCNLDLFIFSFYCRCIMHVAINSHTTDK